MKSDGEDSLPGLSIRLFGDLEVYVDGKPLPKMRTRKELLLLALLVLAHDRDVERRALAQQLWSFKDFPEDRALENLKRSLSELRKGLGRHSQRLVTARPGYVCLELMGAWADVIVFDAAVLRNSVESLQEAVRLCRAPLLHGYTDECLDLEREKRQQAYQNALRQLAAFARSNGDDETAIDLLRQAIAANPRWEPTVRALMQTLYVSGNLNEAIQVYMNLREHLRIRHHAMPETETTNLYLKINQERRSLGEAVGNLAAPPPALRPPAPRPPLYNLPHALHALIGRSDDANTVTTRLLHRARLLTLVGPGGVGKTRLAIQAAEQMKHEFEAGVCFVPLASHSHPALVAQAAAAALGIREEAGQDLVQTLCDALRQKQLLLVLDNCEHLVPACAHLAQSLLAACSGVRILATSRQSLGLQEMTWRVPSLSAPNPAHLPPDDREALALIREHAAIQLFVERAANAYDLFALTPANARDVARICYRLDGIPLAIELAAAQIKMLSPRRIAARLDDVFDLLEDGNNAIPRQQALRATLQWSYDLLSPPECDFFARLAVFHGGWTLEAAEAICGGEGAAVGRSVYGLLDALVDKSLVTVFPGAQGEMRYRMLQTIAEFSRERFRRSEYATALQERHCAWFLALAEQAAPHLRGAGQQEWIERLEADHDNLRAAQDWCCAREDGVAALRLTGALSYFWELSGYFTEGHERLVAALKASADAPDDLRARALIVAGLLADNVGGGDQAVELVEEGLACARRAQHLWLIAYGLSMLGHLHRGRNPTHAGELLDQALSAARQSGELWIITNTLSTLGWHELYSGKLERVEALFEEALKHAQTAGDRWLITEVTYHLGLAKCACGQDEVAWVYLLKNLEMEKELGARMRVSKILLYLATLSLNRGDAAAAHGFLRESLEIARSIDYQRGTAALLEGFARLALATDLPERAIHLFGAADIQRERLEAPLLSLWRPDLDSCLTRLRQSVGAEMFMALWTYGRNLPREAAVAYALG